MPDLGNFDSSKYEDMRSFTVIPPGDYPMQIVKSEKKSTKAGTGEYLNLQIEIIAGEHKGRMLFVILNLWNPSENAVEIANRELATICRAVGAPANPRNSEVLHRIPFIGSVGIEPAQGQWPEKNKLIGYALYDAAKAQSFATSADSNNFDGQIKDIPEWAKEESDFNDDDDLPY